MNNSMSNEYNINIFKLNSNDSFIPAFNFHCYIPSWLECMLELVKKFNIVATTFCKYSLKQHPHRLIFKKKIVKTPNKRVRQILVVLFNFFQMRNKV